MTSNGGPPAGLADDVLAWRDHGDVAASARIAELLHAELVELCGDLGLLFAQDEASRAIRSALRMLRPRGGRARRLAASTSLLAEEVERDPTATFHAMCVEVLLDSAKVPLPSRRRRDGITQRAALRLQSVYGPS